MDPSDQLADILRETANAFTRYSMSGFFRFAKEKDLSPSQLGTLMHLSRGGSRGVGHVGCAMNQTSAAASQMVDRLVQRGWVERIEAAEDRRSKRISLTEAGATAVKDCVDSRQRWVEGIPSRLSADEAQLVGSALKLLLAKAKELEEENPGRRVKEMEEAK